MSEASANKRVAKNAVALTLRMVLVTIVGLYTSRIVLEALGVDDYGIYGVIGGVVGIASFLNTSLAGATSRFITFELGRGNEDRLKNIFSTSLIIHFIIALFVALLAETVGLWFVNNKMNFPDGSQFAVNILYQFTIVTMMINFTQVPYSACIIAHEKMNIYAYLEIFGALLKLGVVYLLLIVHENRLILYAALTMCLTMLTAFIYRIYCTRKFKEARFHFIIDKVIMKEMFTFSGYDLYGNMCVAVKIQGVPIILNMFFGVVANAASTLATTVTGVSQGFSSSILQAFRPQIIKTYANGEIISMQNMMRRSIQFGLLVFGYLALPILIETHSVLELWLGQVPTYSVVFLQLIIIVSFFSMITTVNNVGIHATGNIKNISFISGTLFLLNPVISWVLLRYIIKVAALVYIVDICLYISVGALGWYFLKKQINDFNISQYALSIIRSLLALLLTFILVSTLTNRMTCGIGDNSLSMLISLGTCVLINFVVLTISTYLIALSKNERQYFSSVISQKLWFRNYRR